MKEIIVNGKALPIHFGLKAINEFTKLQNGDFHDTVTTTNSLGSLDSIVALTVSGLNEGARKSKSEVRRRKSSEAKLTYEKWFAVAVGQMGLRPDDFNALTPAEFIYAWIGWSEQEHNRTKQAWERERWSVWVAPCIQLDKKDRQPMTQGDNPGARIDPEVIALLSKLQGMMSGGRGSQEYTNRPQRSTDSQGQGFGICSRQREFQD